MPAVFVRENTVNSDIRQTNPSIVDLNKYPLLSVKLPLLQYCLRRNSKLEIKRYWFKLEFFQTKKLLLTSIDSEVRIKKYELFLAMIQNTNVLQLEFWIHFPKTVQIRKIRTHVSFIWSKISKIFSTKQATDISILPCTKLATFWNVFS